MEQEEDVRRKRYRVAVHEAGHAVTAHLLGSQLVRVSIERDEAEQQSHRGFCDAEPGPIPSRVPCAEDLKPPFSLTKATHVLIAILLAGSLAEVTVLGTACPKAQSFEGFRADDVARSEWGGFFPSARQRAEEYVLALLRHHVGPVRALADALMEHGTLTRLAACLIIEAHLPGR